MRTARRLTAVLAAAGLILAACGGSDDDAIDDAATTDVAVGEEPVDTEPAEEAPAETEPAEEEPAETEPAEEAPAETEPAEEAPAETEPAEEAPAETEPAEEAPAETEPAEAAPAAGDAIMASLVEWAIEAPTEYAAGEITFTASNDGSFPHEFVVIRGEGYASLPLTESGAVIEDELPEGALIGRTNRIAGGGTEDLVVDLEPGGYVLVCNLGGGSNSHAGQGQNLDIVVS